MRCKICSSEEQHVESRKMCRPCVRAEAKRRYEDTKRWTQIMKLRLGCSICGYRKNPCALEFHHIDPSTKSFNISEPHRSKKQLKAEIAKCVVLCANCHREEEHPWPPKGQES